MATPLGHALAGYAVSVCGKESRGRLSLTLLYMGAAVAPDLDVVPGLLQGQPVLYHGSVTHSLGAALLFSVVAATLFYVWKRTSFWTVFSLCCIAYTSHLLLDYIGPDGRAPYGIPLFWPLSNTTHLSPIPLLLGMHHVGSTTATIPEFVRGILTPYNLLAIALEAAVIVPFIVLGQRYLHRPVSQPEI